VPWLRRPNPPTQAKTCANSLSVSGLGQSQQEHRDLAARGQVTDGQPSSV
jgi:hypothetical protein